MERGKITLNEIAKAGIARAARWLQGASRALEDKRWDDVVYNAQMAVEHSVNAVLLAFGISFPREHDVSPVLLRLKKQARFPGWFSDELERIARVVSELAEQRALAGYGFEMGVDVETFRELAPKALEEARRTHNLCKKLLGTMATKRV